MVRAVPGQDHAGRCSVWDAMPLRLTAIERLIFHEGNLGPGPIVDLYGSFAAKGILVALRLGLFEALASKPLHSEELWWIRRPAAP